MTNRQVPTDKELLGRATKLARRAGVDWSFIASQCTELVVFGSRAAGLETPFSDLDVLVVRKHGLAMPLPRVRGIDLVFRTEDEILSAEWLKSEMAGHIAPVADGCKGLVDGAIMRWQYVANPTRRQKPSGGEFPASRKRCAITGTA